MIALRLERLGHGRLDLVLANLPGATLVRTSGALLLCLDAAGRADAVRGLALAGVRATEAAIPPAPPPGLVAAVGRSLAPLGVPLASDAIVLRRVPLGAACRDALGGRFVRWRRDPVRRGRCRALLRGEEVAYRWARRAWATPAVLRGPARRALRPVVFEHVDPSVPPAPDRLAYASEGALARWAFG